MSRMTTAALSSFVNTCKFTRTARITISPTLQRHRQGSATIESNDVTMIPAWGSKIANIISDFGPFSLETWSKTLQNFWPPAAARKEQTRGVKSSL